MRLEAPESRLGAAEAAWTGLTSAAWILTRELQGEVEAVEGRPSDPAVGAEVAARRYTTLAPAGQTMARAGRIQVEAAQTQGVVLRKPAEEAQLREARAKRLAGAARPEAGHPSA